MSSPTLHQRMQEVMRRVESVYKGDYNKHHHYKFASHDQVTAAVRKHMAEVGIVQEVSVVEYRRQDMPSGSVVCVHLRISWISADNREDRQTVDWFSESNPGGKGGANPQQIGTAISYGVKMAILKNFALVGDDSDDVDSQSVAPANVETGRTIAAVQPPPQQPPQTLFQYFAAGFPAVSTEAQLNTLMRDISSRRTELNDQEIKDLATMWKARKKELGL